MISSWYVGITAGFLVGMMVIPALAFAAAAMDPS